MYVTRVSYSNTFVKLLHTFAPKTTARQQVSRSPSLISPRCNAGPHERWSAAYGGHFWPDVYFRLLPNASDSRTARHNPHTQTPKHGKQHATLITLQIFLSHRELYVQNDIKPACVYRLGTWTWNWLCVSPRSLLVQVHTAGRWSLLQQSWSSPHCSPNKPAAEASDWGERETHTDIDRDTERERDVGKAESWLGNHGLESFMWPFL